MRIHDYLDFRGFSIGFLLLLGGSQAAARPPALETGEPPAAAVASSSRKPLPGAFLVASRWLQDSNFGETVVFLLEAGEKGAMGVIINRRTAVSAAEALPQLTALQGRQDFLYAGGPVQPLEPLFLASASSPPEGSKDVLEGEVFLLRSSEAVTSLLEDPTSGSVRIFAGYAGWGAGQLEAEIARSDWHVLPGSSRWIFADDPENVWLELLEVVLRPTA